MDTKLEIRESIDIATRKEELMYKSIFELWQIIVESPQRKYTYSELLNDLVEIILEHNLDLD